MTGRHPTQAPLTEWPAQTVIEVRVSHWLNVRTARCRYISRRLLSLDAVLASECQRATLRRLQGDEDEARAHEAAAEGCLAAMVCEAWGDPSLYAADGWNLRGEHGWHVSSTLRRGGDMPSCGHGPTKVEALLAALESAP